MKVLVVHNRYRSAIPSGENRVVDDEIAMLRGASVEVDSYIRDSDEIEAFSLLRRTELAVRPIYSIEDAGRFRRKLAEFRPDVVHLHNPFPLISPWIVRVAHRLDIPVVQTVHNYRHVCIRGTFFRDGRICEDCRDKRFPLPAVAHGCYRDSRAQSVVMASALAFHRRTWMEIDHYLPVSEFVADHLERAGVPRSRMTVKPNAVPEPGPPAPLGRGFLFAGRLDVEKGILLLLEAWRQADVNDRLVVAGDGPLRPAVEAAVRADGRIEYVGLVLGDGVQRLLREVAVTVVPSIWFEGFPRLVAESFAAGRPVLVSMVGSFSRIVSEEVGWLARPQVEDLAASLRRASPQSALTRGRKAREAFEANFSVATVTEQLTNVYDQVTRGTLAALRHGC